MGLTLSSCISVKVPFEASTKADNVNYKNPDEPFSTLDTDAADSAWISDKTGNTISFLSECKDQKEKLEDVAQESVKAIEKLRILKKQKIEISQQEAFEIIATGIVNESRIKTIVTTVKNNKCVFTLSYGGLEKNFNEELAYYEKFKRGFKVP